MLEETTSQCGQDMRTVDRRIRSLSSFHVKTVNIWKAKENIYKNVYFSDAENDVMHVNVPVSKPSGYNATANPVAIKLHLDPNCRYEIT